MQKVRCHAAAEVHDAENVFDKKTTTSYLTYEHGGVLWARSKPGLLQQERPIPLEETLRLPAFRIATVPTERSDKWMVGLAAVELGRMTPVDNARWVTKSQAEAGIAQLPAPPSGDDLLVARTSAPKFWTGIDRFPLAIPGVIAALLALIGMADLPYAYYEFLRDALSVTAVVVGVIACRSGKPWWLVLSGVMIVFWAPAAFVPLERETWVVLDLLVAVALVVGSFTVPAVSPVNSEGKPIRRLRGWTLAFIIAGVAFLGIWSAGSGTGGDPDCTVMQDTRGSYCG